jgi:hypothetical protein
MKKLLILLLLTSCSGDMEDSLTCRDVANIIYRTNLNEAIADPSIPGLQGYSSAREYAEVTRRSSFSRCSAE